MAITYNGQLFQDLKLIIAEWNTAVTNLATLRTNEGVFLTTVNEATLRTEEHVPMGTAGGNVFSVGKQGHNSVMSQSVRFAQNEWIAYAAKHMSDNGVLTVTDRTLANVLNVLFTNMTLDTETIDASVPTISAVTVDDTNNQGDGTITVAINGDTTRAELALAGELVLRCVSAGFSVQNQEVWQLEHTTTNPRTALEQTRVSPTRIVTGESDVEDVVEDAQNLPVPQVGGSIHTGAIVNITTPSYNTVVESGDTLNAFTNYNVQAKDGTKSNLTRDNTTFVGGGANGNGTISLNCVRTAGAPVNWALTWYRETTLDTALSDTISFDEGDGDQTLTWKPAATNPEVGVFLSTADNFIQADIDDSAIQVGVATFRVDVTAPLPWGIGDKAEATITNAYGGVISRFFTQELGYPLPVNNAGTETITDP